MTLDHLWTQVAAALREHSVKLVVGFLLMVVGWYFGRRRAHHHWKKQEFLDRLNVSLNMIENGTLKFRTLSEKRCESVFLNTVAAETVQRLARQTTAADPILPIPESDMWYYLNAILNDLSEQFAAGALRRDQGAPVSTAVYLLTLTCETAGDLRTRKIRAMVMRKSVLTQLPVEMPQLESDRHGTRWKTLQFMAAEYIRNPWRFREVEISV